MMTFSRWLVRRLFPDAEISVKSMEKDQSVRAKVGVLRGVFR